MQDKSIPFRLPGDLDMHITDINENNLAELKEYLEVINNKVLTKKIKPNPLKSDYNYRTHVGKERGCITKYGKTGSFVFNDKSRLNFKNREIIWVFNNGLIPKGKRVVPINGDVLDDRIENLKLIDKGKNGRPIGKSDHTRRANRSDDGFTSKKISEVEKLREDGFTNNQIAEMTELSFYQVKSIIRKHLKKHMNPNKLSERRTCLLENIEEMEKGVSGIYVISFIAEGFQKYYIGSSNCIRYRCMNHRRKLQTGKHYSKKMLEAFSVPGCIVRVHVWKEVNEEDLLKEERETMSSVCKGSLLNTWNAVALDDIKNYLDVAASRIKKNRYQVTIDGCWIWNTVNKEGYGKDIRVKVCQNTKSFGKIYSGNKWIKPHRASYYKATGEYPELIRHKCGNRRCVNPDHLETGSHADNNKDTHKNKWYLFETKWKEYNGDYVKLTEYFGYKANYKDKNGKRYYAGMRKIAKKLGLLG